MSEENKTDTPTPSQATTMQMIWIALLVSVGIYAVVGTIAAPQNPVPPAPVQTMLMVFIALAFGQTAFAMMAPRILTKLPAFPLLITRLAVAESIAVCGMIFRFIGGSANMFYMFIVWSALLMLTLRPNQDIQK